MGNIKKYMISTVSNITFWDPTQPNKKQKNQQQFNEENLSQMKAIYNEIYSKRNEFVDGNLDTQLIFDMSYQKLVYSFGFFNFFRTRCRR